jgi:hypothetical protein
LSADNSAQPVVFIQPRGPNQRAGAGREIDRKKAAGCHVIRRIGGIADEPDLIGARGIGSRQIRNESGRAG